MGTILAMFLVFSSGGCVVSAQEQAKTSNEDAGTADHYSPPSAAQSVEVGSYYLRRKKFDAALSRFHEALTTDPHYALAYIEQGKAYEGLGQRQNALDSYRTYLKEISPAQGTRKIKRVRKAIARLEKQSPTQTKPPAIIPAHT